MRYQPRRAITRRRTQAATTAALPACVSSALHARRSLRDESGTGGRLDAAYPKLSAVAQSGRGGIRTHGGLAPSTIFKIAAIVRSATLPVLILLIECKQVLAISTLYVLEHAVEVGARKDPQRRQKVIK